MNNNIIANECCISINEETIIYFLLRPNREIGIKNISYSYSKYSFKNFEIIKSTSRNNYFYLKIKGNIRKFRNRFIDITYSDNTKNEKLKLIFPFNKLYLKLHKNANIISTMCMNYSNRLDEWLKYNLKLGFDGIVIFNNGNEINSNYINKNKDKILIVNYPYKIYKCLFWNSIQSLSISIGTHAFKYYCKFIALIDADEFIYIPKCNNIKNFLSKYNRSIQFQSNLLTNISNNEKYNNNLLSLCKYVGPDKYSKIIINTKDINLNYDFVMTPHVTFPKSLSIKLGKETIIHYHVWVNDRLQYNKDMKKINFLEDFLYK